MAAAVYNFIIEQGSDFSIVFQYNDANGKGIDLTSKCVLLRFIDNLSQNIKTFNSCEANSLAGPNGYSLTADNAGTIALQISAKITKGYTFDIANYELDVVQGLLSDIDYKNTRISTGQISILKRSSGIAVSDGQNNGNPTTTPTVTVTNPTVTSQITDLCLPDCLTLDVYSTVYTGSGLSILDNQSVSGSVNVTNTGLIENIEIAINGLRHDNPQDLRMFLCPPSGNKVLLSANNKISNYQSGFSFMFSNKAPATTYLNTVSHGGICNILDKTSIVKFSNETLTGSLTGLFNRSGTGNWALLLNDSDIGGSGSIDSWKLIVTYVA
jgi:subtilisin-like proprotein convertase family protein